MDNTLAGTRYPTGSIRVRNVVSVSTLGRKLDLHKLSTLIPEASYNPKKLNAVIIRLPNPKVTCMIFSTGSMTSAGGSSIFVNWTGARKCIDKVQRHEPVAHHSYKVVNMVASCNMGYPIDLKKLRMEYQPNAVYEPELFAGLTLRLSDPKVTAVIFHNGKFQIVGTKTHSQVHNAYIRLLTILRHYMH